MAIWKVPLTDYNEAIGRNPALADAFVGRALLWKAKGELGKAESDMSRAIALNPRNAQSYCNRGLVLLQQGKKDEAEKDFVQCLALDPELRASFAERIKELNPRSGGNGPP